MTMRMQQHTLYINGVEQGDPLRVSTGRTSAPGGTIWAVDGGVTRLPAESRASGDYAFVGDGDSAGDALLQGRLPREVTNLPVDKSVSDFGVVLDAIAEGIGDDEGARVDVYFGLGGRRDHEWVNIAEAARWAGALSGRGIVIFHPGVVVASCAFRVATRLGAEFTLVAPGARVETIRVEGARWDGNIRLERPSMGLSNKASAEEVAIWPERGAVVCFMLA